MVICILYLFNIKAYQPMKDSAHKIKTPAPTAIAAYLNKYSISPEEPACVVPKSPIKNVRVGNALKIINRLTDSTLRHLYNTNRTSYKAEMEKRINSFSLNPTASDVFFMENFLDRHVPGDHGPAIKRFIARSQKPYENLTTPVAEKSNNNTGYILPILAIFMALLTYTFLESKFKIAPAKSQSLCISTTKRLINKDGPTSPQILQVDKESFEKLIAETDCQIIQ